jgi:hypothetical protein
VVAQCAVCGGGATVGCGCGAAFSEAVALAFEGDHVGVVDEAVDEGGGVEVRAGGIPCDRPARLDAREGRLVRQSVKNSTSRASPATSISETRALTRVN